MFDCEFKNVGSLQSELESLRKYGVLLFWDAAILCGDIKKEILWNYGLQESLAKGSNQTLILCWYFAKRKCYWQMD